MGCGVWGVGCVEVWGVGPELGAAPCAGSGSSSGPRAWAGPETTGTPSRSASPAISSEASSIIFFSAAPRDEDPPVLPAPRDEYPTVPRFASWEVPCPAALLSALGAAAALVGGGSFVCARYPCSRRGVAAVASTLAADVALMLLGVGLRVEG